MSLVVGIGEELADVFRDAPRFWGAPSNFACIVAGLATERLETTAVSAGKRATAGTESSMS